MKTFYVLLCLFLSVNIYGQSDTLYTQNYLDKSTRFAWLTYGGDINYLTGGSTQQFIEGTKETVNFGQTIMPRLTIGGIHFWGHTDFLCDFFLYPFSPYKMYHKDLMT